MKTRSPETFSNKKSGAFQRRLLYDMQLVLLRHLNLI
jgi:hypothetical protein